MSVIALASFKHAPGVTTLAVALAQAFDDAGNETLVLDGDPMGGDIAAYTGLPTEPGLVTLAAACRHPDANLEITPHTVELPNGGAALLSSGIAGQSSAVLAVLASRLVAALHVWHGIAIVDCGRIWADSPALPLATNADRLVVVAEPTVAGIVHVRDELDRLARFDAKVDLVVSGEGPYRADEIEGVTSCSVLAVIPHDSRGATGVMGALTPRAAGRTPLGRAARSLVDSSLADTSDPVTSDDAQESEGVLR